MGATFSRASVAYKQDGAQVAANLPRFEPGKFGQAVMVEEGTTNNLPNNRFANTSNWAFFTDGGGTFTVASNWGKITRGTVTFTFIRQPRVATVPANTAQTFSTTFKNNVVGQAGIRVALLRADGSLIAGPESTITLDNSGGTKRFSLTASAAEEAARTFVDVLLGTAYRHNPRPDFVEFSYAQLETKPYATSFIDGTRSPETLTVPTAGVLSPTAGTMEQYARLLRSPGTNEQFIFDGAGAAANQNLQVLIATNGRPTLRYGTGAATVEIQGATAWVKDTWYAIAWKWEAAGVKLLVNGAVVASSATAPSLAFGANAFLGSRADNALHLGGLIDDLRISSRARTDAEILAGYNSNAPLPADADTTAKFTFDNVLTNLFTTYAGLTELEVLPSSEREYAYTHAGLTVAETLPLAGVIAWGPYYLHNQRGTAPADPLIRLQGVSLGGIQSLAIHVGEQTVRYMGALAEGDWLEIDCQAKTAVRVAGADRTNMLPFLERPIFPQLAPGVNNIAVSAWGAAWSALEVHCRNRWL